VGSKIALHLARFGAFPLAVQLTGTLWALVDVFLLGHWEPKFGRGGTFLLALGFVATIAAASLVAGAIVAVLFQRRTAGWTARRHGVVGAAAGILVIAFVVTGAIVVVGEWIGSREHAVPIAAGLVLLASGLALAGCTLAVRPPPA